MKKTLITFVAVAFISVFTISCNCERDENGKKIEKTEVTDTKGDKKVTQYACEMKCETSEKPGKCSKCDMEMKEVK